MMDRQKSLYLDVSSRVKDLYIVSALESKENLISYLPFSKQ